MWDSLVHVYNARSKLYYDVLSSGSLQGYHILDTPGKQTSPTPSGLPKQASQTCRGKQADEPGRPASVSDALLGEPPP